MNETKQKRRFSHWVTDLLIWCVPSLLLVVLFICIPGLILDRGTIVTLLPVLLLGLVITRLIFLFRSHRAVWAKIWRTVVWLALAFVVFFFGTFFPIKLRRNMQTDAQSKFEASVNRILPDALSAPLELGSPKTVVLHEYLEADGIWMSKSYTLLCQYDAADYEAAKAALETKHSFRTELLNTGVKGVMVEPYVSIGNDFFRLLWPLDGDKKSWEFYKESLFMMTNDVEHQIGFIVFQDVDLDYVDDLTEFLNEWCGWKNIR